MKSNDIRNALLAGAAFALAAPGAASAAGDTAAELAARLKQMEAEMATMRGKLEALEAQSSKQDQSIIRLDQKAATPAAPAPQKPEDGFRVGETVIKLGGYVKAEALISDYSDGDVATGSTGRDFFVPSSIPVGGSSEDTAYDAHAKQTRLSLTATRDVKDHKLQAYVEADFQSSPGTGTENVTNAYNFAVRRAYLTFDNWTFGQDWTTFQNVATLPETTDFIGPSDGTVFARQALIRYTHPLAKNLSLALAAENPETTAYSLAAATITGYDDDAMPDLIARLNWTPGKHQFALAAIGRRLSVQNGAVDDDASGWGVSASGKLAVGAKDDLRFMVTTGEGLGRYLGINFAPDVVIDAANGLQAISETGGFVAYRHMWTDRLRSTVSYSFLSVDNDSGITPALANDFSQSWSANLFFSPVKGLDLGVEYRHAERELFSGASGDMDRLHFAAKQSF